MAGGAGAGRISGLRRDAAVERIWVRPERRQGREPFDFAQGGPDHFFTGFPSYWNIVAVYLYVLQLPQRTNAIILVVLAILVFVPVRYLYPSRTRTLKVPTLVLGTCGPRYSRG